MWIVFAIGSAFFAGLTAILAKLGIRHTDSTVATAIRTIVVVLCSWGMVFLTHVQSTIGAIEPRTLFFLILSGLATGASWLCYFKALQTGPVAQVAAIDKSSTVLTILLAFLLLHETVSWASTLGVLFIALGTWLMLDHKPSNQKSTDFNISLKSTWLWYAAGSAIFASLSAILGKVGIENIDSNVGTAIRTIVVLIMSWIMVLITHKQDTIKKISRRELGFILASGLATGASWLCYYRALHLGPASGVVPIDKLSILVTVFFSVTVLHEKLSRMAWTGLAIQTIGTLLMVLPV